MEKPQACPSADALNSSSTLKLKLHFFSVRVLSQLQINVSVPSLSAFEFAIKINTSSDIFGENSQNTLYLMGLFLISTSITSVFSFLFQVNKNTQTLPF